MNNKSQKNSKALKNKILSMICILTVCKILVHYNVTHHGCHHLCKNIFTLNLIPDFILSHENKKLWSIRCEFSLSLAFSVICYVHGLKSCLLFIGLFTLYSLLLYTYLHASNAIQWLWDKKIWRQFFLSLSFPFLLAHNFISKKAFLWIFEISRKTFVWNLIW